MLENVMMNPLIFLLFIRNENRPVFYLSIKNRSVSLASPRRFELPAPRLGGVCSIQLSYEDICNFSQKKQTHFT